MNRHERRRAAKQQDTAKAMAIYTHWGHLRPTFKHYKQPTICYICDAEHGALDVVADDGRDPINHHPICKRCAGDNHSVIRKYWDAPKLKIVERGEATTEQLEAIIERAKSNAIEH
jgi:hypothetical protein